MPSSELSPDSPSALAILILDTIALVIPILMIAWIGLSARFEKRNWFSTARSSIRRPGVVLLLLFWFCSVIVLVFLRVAPGIAAEQAKDRGTADRNGAHLIETSSA